jgi:predicted nucleic acid-binding protein
MPETFLLDTSALMSLIENEAGADRVEYLLRNEKTLIPWAALMEVYYMSLQERGQEIAEARFSMLNNSPAPILWEMHEASVILSAEIKGRHRVSFADAVMAGFAIHHNAILVHKDPEMEALNNKVRMELLPYKA